MRRDIREHTRQLSELEQKEMTMRTITRSEMKSEGKVIVGEFGLGSASTSGHVICRPEDRKAVKAAYDAIVEGDLSQDVLADVEAVGGEHVVGM